MNHKERKSRPIRTAGSDNSDSVVASELSRPATKVKQKPESYFKQAAPGTLLRPVDVQCRQSSIDYKINQAALQAFAERGLVAPNVIVRTGCGKVWERCKTIDKLHHQNGAYSAYPDFPFTILLENHADGQGVTRWACHKGIHITPDILAAMRARDAENLAANEEQQAEDKAAAQQRAWRFLRSCKPCTKHPYTSSKGFPKLAENLRLLQKDGWLVIVLFGEDGKPTGGYQRIKWGVNSEEEGFVKLFAKGIAQAGTYAIIPPDNGIVKHIVVCEGYATGLSIHFAFPDHLIYCAMDAGNLVATAQIANRKYPTVSITIAADNDSNKVGINAALSAQKAVDAPSAAIAMPTLVGADWNDIHAEEGLAAMREQFKARNNDFPQRMRIFNSIDGVNNSEDMPVFDEEFYNMGDFEVLSKTPPKKDIHDADKKQHPENAAATNGEHTEAKRHEMENPQPDADNASGTASGSKPGQKGIDGIVPPAAAAPGTVKPDGTTNPGGEHLAANSGKQAEKSATPEHEDLKRVNAECIRLASTTEENKDAVLESVLYNIGRIIHAGNIPRADAEKIIWDALKMAGYAHGDKSEEIKKYIELGISDANADPSLKTWGADAAGYIHIGKSQAEVDALTVEKSALLVDAEEKSRKRKKSIKEFIAMQIPEREFLLSPIIQQQGLAMLHARAGIGKTFLALHVAAAIASGSSMLDGRWIAPKPRKAFYLDGEMDQRSFRDRIAVIAKCYDIQEDFFDVMTPGFLQDDEVMPNLAEKNGQKIADEWIGDAEFVVIDNLACLCRNAKTNDAESWIVMQDWLMALRRRGKSVLVLHHDGKSGEQRGTSAKEDILDTVIALKQSEQQKEAGCAWFSVLFDKHRSFFADDARPFDCKLFHSESQKISKWEVRSMDGANTEWISRLVAENQTQKQIIDITGLSQPYVSKVMSKISRGMMKTDCQI